MNQEMKTVVICLATMYAVFHITDIRRLVTNSF